MPDFTPARNYLNKAAITRREGLEGKSRVLCRLAAASAIKTYLVFKNRNVSTTNAYEAILEFSRYDSLPVEIMEALDHLSMRVDQDYNLPAGIDLIQDVEDLLGYLNTRPELSGEA